MALAPNCLPIVRALAQDYPAEFADCHNFSLPGVRPWAFIRRLAWVLHTSVDQRFGMNGKRGDVTDPSADAVSFRNPASAAGGVEIIDVVAGAGGPNPSPAWQDVTQATIHAGTVGAYIQPQPVSSTKPDPEPVPPPGCTCADDIAGLYEAIGNLVAEVARLTTHQDATRAVLVGHLDDVKVRVERVSQELANRPVPKGCKLPW